MTQDRADLLAGPFLRATVVGPSRVADVVLPTDQPVGSMIPSLLELVEFPAGGQGHHLVTIEGSALPPGALLRDTVLRDGVLLRLVAADESPPDPVVYDLVDAVEEERPWGLWDVRHRGWGLCLVAATLLLTAALLATTLPDVGLTLALGVLGLVALAGSAVTRWTGPVGAAWVWLGVSWAALLVAALTDLPDRRPLWVVVGVPVLLLSLGWTAGRVRASVAGLAAWVMVVSAALITWWFTQDPSLSAGVVAVVATALIGLAPRLALATTGAFRLDGELTRGADLRARQVGPAVASAHLSLVGLVVVLAISAGLALHVAALSTAAQPWMTALVATLSVGWLTRVRHFPLVLERVLVWATALLGLSGLMRVGLQTWPGSELWWVAGTALAAVLVMLAMTRPPNPLQSASARRWAARLETLTVVAALPLLVGAFGVYADLLQTF